MNNKRTEPKGPGKNQRAGTKPSRSESSPTKTKTLRRGKRRSSVMATSTRPWALIVTTTTIVVLFAAFGLFYAIKATNDKTRQDAANDPTQIKGLQSYDFSTKKGDHQKTAINYDQTPPAGGPHDPEWADCTGTVYTVQIRNENAVHSLEHGAVWLTYDPAVLAADQVAKLAKLVQGKNFTMLSPYPSQGAPISVQSWGHQLTVSTPTDPRLKAFINGFRQNPTFTPEPGATCQNPQFKTSPKIPSGAPVLG